MDRNDYYGAESASLNLTQVTNKAHHCLLAQSLKAAIFFLVFRQIQKWPKGT